MIAVDLSQQINFTVNLDRTENTKLFFIIEEAKETVLNFSKGTVKVLLQDNLNLKYKMAQENGLNGKL